jgi:hypothetical protein
MEVESNPNWEHYALGPGQIGRNRATKPLLRYPIIRWEL